MGHNAALSLRKLGTASDSAIDMLLKAATHPELYRRKNALMALEALLGQLFLSDPASAMI